MHKKLVLISFLVIALLFAFGCTKTRFAGPSESGAVTLDCSDDGGGTGKTLSALKVTVTYFDPFFYTEEGYPGYYINMPLTCKLTIKNTSHSDFNGLTVKAVHEYYESGVCERWWYPYPREAEFTKGEPLPGDADAQWSVDIKAGCSKSMEWTYTPPMETCSGLDQTHVIITKDDGETVVLNSPEAGIFCPPPPAK